MTSDDHQRLADKMSLITILPVDGGSEAAAQHPAILQGAG